MKMRWLLFPTQIEIRSSRSIAECAEAIRLVVAEPARMEKGKPYVGWVNELGGQIRQRFRYGLHVMPARVLTFRLESHQEGCLLEGHFQLRKLILIPVSAYFLLCAAGEVLGLFAVTKHLFDTISSLCGPILGFLMIYGWTWLIVRLNRRSDDEMVRALVFDEGRAFSRGCGWLIVFYSMNGARFLRNWVSRLENRSRRSGWRR
jgi:hypothetical protein